jgi:hypothetical protein
MFQRNHRLGEHGATGFPLRWLSLIEASSSNRNDPYFRMILVKNTAKMAVAQFEENHRLSCG